MKINLSDDKTEIEKQLKMFIDNELFSKLPFLKDTSTILVAGSVASNTYDNNSDIDLHIIRSENIQKEYLNKLKDYKNELLNSESNIELRFSRTFEVLEEYLNWNDDYILGEFQSATVLYDANNWFKDLMDKFDWYPNDIFNDKAKWLLSEMLLITEKELDSAIERGHIYYIEVLRTKYLRFILTLIRLLNRKYPIYDKKLFETTQTLTGIEGIQNTVEEILKIDNYPKMLKKMKSLNEIMLEKAKETIKEELNQKNLLIFSTKNKIIFE